MKKMAILKKGNLQFIETLDNLENYYKLLECDLIQVINIKINDIRYSLILDDEGKLKEHYVNLVFLDKNDNQIDYIANHAIIQKYDYEKEETINLSEKDISNLINWYDGCIKLIDFENGRYVPTIKIQ